MEEWGNYFLKLEKSHLAAENRQSAERLLNILDDEFFEFGSSGGVHLRSELDGDTVLGADDYRISRFEARELGPESVLTLYLLENRTTETWSHRSSIWKKRQDGWKLYFHQGTRTDGFKKWK